MCFRSSVSTRILQPTYTLFNFKWQPFIYSLNGSISIVKNVLLYKTINSNDLK